MLKDENYIHIQAFMVKDLHLKGNELLVYAIIFGFSQTEGQCFNGGLTYLSEFTSSTKQGVIKNLKSLIAKGLIDKKEVIVNNIKFVEYRVTQFNTPLVEPLNSVECPVKLSLPNNKYNNKVDINNKNNIYIDEFEQLWKLYPKKQGKDRAIKSYVKARKEGTEYSAVEQGIKDYVEDIKREKKEPRFIKQGI